MEIDRFQVDAALHCPQKRRERRERNLPVIKAGHYLAINTPELFCAQKPFRQAWFD